MYSTGACDGFVCVRPAYDGLPTNRYRSAFAKRRHQPNQDHNLPQIHMAVPRKNTYPAGRQPTEILPSPCIPGRILPPSFETFTRATKNRLSDWTWLCGLTTVTVP